MQKNFSGYYRPSNEVLTEIWQKCIFVLDTNVLLGLYRYPQKAHDELINAFSQISDRLWIPHQVALEYQENRLSVISEQLVKYEDVSKIITESQENLKKNIDNLQLKKRHSVIDPESFLSKVSCVFGDFIKELENLKNEQPDISDEDSVRLDIDKLLENKIGDPLTFDELKKLYEDGEVRYEQRRPPGYLDKGKSKQDENKFHFFGNLAIKREFGDLIIWYQLKKEIKSKNTEHVIFITDDDKDDWWWTYKGKTIGARPELVLEIQQETGAKSFYMYSSARFLEYAKEFLGAKINQETINQVSEISELQKSANFPSPSNINRESQVGKLVYNWLQSKFDAYEIVPNDRFNKFSILIDDQNIAYEVIYIRHPRLIYLKGRESGYRGFYEVSKGNYSLYYFAFVIDHSMNAEIRRWVERVKIPEGVKLHIFEAFTTDDEVVDLHFLQELPGYSQ